MITIGQIQSSIGLANAYYLQLISIDISDLKLGACAQYAKKVKCLNRLIRALQWDVNLNYIGTTTIALYDLLLKEISTYSGAALPYDPNAYNPNNVIVINTSLPTPVEITTAQMTLSGTRYDNTSWKGFNPFMILDNTTWLQNRSDYSLLPTGGFTLNPTGNLPTLYDGQILRAITYQLA